MNTSFESIWDEFSSPLKAFVNKHIGNERDAEDILQIIFLKIYNNISNLGKVVNLSSWIYTISRNTIYDFYRSQKHNLSIDKLSEDIFIDQQEEETLNKEIGKCLIKMVQYLPEIYREALILTEFNEYTQKEMAVHLGISVSTAKSRVQRARLKLKDMIQNCCLLEQDHKGNIIDYKKKNNKCIYC